MTDTRLGIQEEEEEFIRDFNEVGDWLLQYDCLLSLTVQMQPLRPEERCEANRITSCQAALWLVLSYENGRVHIRADSESLIVKGIVAVIIALLDDRTPAEICAARLHFIERTSLYKQISTDRFNGMQNLIRMIKDYAGQCASGTDSMCAG